MNDSAKPRPLPILALAAACLAAAPGGLRAAPTGVLEAAKGLEVSGVGGAEKLAQTLYVSGDPAAVYMDPAAIEAMPDGFEEKDLEKIEVGYRMFGETRKIQAVKGSELNRGEQVRWSGVKSEDGAWLQIEKGGMAGWMRAEELSQPGWTGWKPELATAFKTRPAAKDQRRRAFIEEALSHEGDNYVWGGRSPGGFDCSGLVQYSMDVVWPGNGVPRVSRDQQSAARPVASAADLKEGDLVFTGDPVKHVMIVVDESGDLVEAMGRKWGVRRSELSRRIGDKPHFFGTFFED